MNLGKTAPLREERAHASNQVITSEVAKTRLEASNSQCVFNGVGACVQPIALLPYNFQPVPTTNKLHPKLVAHTPHKNKRDLKQNSQIMAGCPARSNSKQSPMKIGPGPETAKFKPQHQYTIIRNMSSVPNK